MEITNEKKMQAKVPLGVTSILSLEQAVKSYGLMYGWRLTYSRRLINRPSFPLSVAGNTSRYFIINLQQLSVNCLRDLTSERSWNKKTTRHEKAEVGWTRCHTCFL